MVEDFSVGLIVNTAGTTDLAPEIVAAYDAPFPDDRYEPALASSRCSC